MSTVSYSNAKTMLKDSILFKCLNCSKVVCKLPNQAADRRPPLRTWSSFQKKQAVGNKISIVISDVRLPWALGNKSTVVTVFERHNHCLCVRHTTGICLSYSPSRTGWAKSYSWSAPVVQKCCAEEAGCLEN